MNKHLINFFDDELKTNSYYDDIRKFAGGKDWDKDILGPIISEYEGNIDNFGPYRFMDAIEDFIEELSECNPKSLEKLESLDEVIEKGWDLNYFERY